MACRRNAPGLSAKPITAEVAKPYFRDWKNLKHAGGKAWIANERLWKREVSIWFPNLRGRTLDKEQNKGGVDGLSDVVGVLRGKVSIVGVFSRTWAQRQCHSWYGDSANQEVKKLMDGCGGKAQIVEIDIEDKPLMQAIQRLFERSMRWNMKKEQWGKRFFLTGLPESVKEEIGVVNAAAGYVYLVDKDCKIRWAGSGEPEAAEKNSLVKGLSRLVSPQRE
jgi:ATPase complex subunit ATP10